MLGIWQTVIKIWNRIKAQIQRYIRRSFLPKHLSSSKSQSEKRKRERISFSNVCNISTQTIKLYFCANRSLNKNRDILNIYWFLKKQSIVNKIHLMKRKVELNNKKKREYIYEKKGRKSLINF